MADHSDLEVPVREGEVTEAYPLKWPDGKERTPRHRRKRANFVVPPGQAIQELLREISLLGGRYPVISSNMPMRLDGLPYAKAPNPEDPGVCVYFELNGRSKVFPCDKWDRVKDNIRAIGKTIENLRGIERWGVTEATDQAFAGFEALPPPTSWRDTFKGCRTADDLQREFRRRAKECHPDNGGDAASFAKLTEHYEQAKRELVST